MSWTGHAAHGLVQLTHYSRAAGESAMPLIRIEPVEDRATGRFAIEIYYPADAERPLVTTAPRYKSAAAAEQDTIAILASSANNPAPEEPASRR